VPFFDKVLVDEFYDQTALTGLCDVIIKGECFKNERIRLDLAEGSIRIEATKYDWYRVPLGKVQSDDFEIKNVSIHSRGIHLTCGELDYSFVSSVGGGSMDVRDTSIASIMGYYSRPAMIKLTCNKAIEFETDCEYFERRFFINFDFHKINLLSNVQLIGSKLGFSISGKKLFKEKNIDNAVAIVVGARAAWASEWEGNRFRIRLNSYSNTPIKARPIMSTGKEFVTLDTARNNAEELFPLALGWLNGLQKQQLSKALVAIQSLISARTQGQNYLLSLFGVFRFWEWADNAKTLSKEPLSKCLSISLEEAKALVQLRNDLTHGAEFFDEAIQRCDILLREVSVRYVKEYDADGAASTVLNYAHSLSADCLMKIIGYEGDTQKYFPLSGNDKRYHDYK